MQANSQKNFIDFTSIENNKNAAFYDKMPRFIYILFGFCLFFV